MDLFGLWPLDALTGGELDPLVFLQAAEAGTAVMRLADADLLPFSFGDLSASVGNYIGDLKRVAGRESAAIRERNVERGCGSASPRACSLKSLL